MAINGERIDYIRTWRKANSKRLKQYRDEYYELNKERYAELNKLYYESHEEQVKLKQKEWRQKHKKECAERARRIKQEKKRKVLTHYGHGRLACVECGESRLVCLSIDHINGGGTQHKKTMRTSMYSYLVKKEFPDGYQTLCMNCQFVKREKNKEYGN